MGVTYEDCGAKLPTGWALEPCPCCEVMRRRHLRLFRIYVCEGDHIHHFERFICAESANRALDLWREGAQLTRFAFIQIETRKEDCFACAVVEEVADIAPGVVQIKGVAWFERRPK